MFSQTALDPYCNKELKTIKVSSCRIVTEAQETGERNKLELLEGLEGRVSLFVVLLYLPTLTMGGGVLSLSSLLLAASWSPKFLSILNSGSAL